jgi:glycerol uptake facilitator-like aquaporin
VRAWFPCAGLATAAIGNGLAFVVLVYATAGISGGHLNPAISTAFVVTGR